MIMALLVLSTIVLFHEFGHFLLARLNGIGVIEFSLGFGPRLLSWKSKKSGTRYSWKLIPFGGSCAMYGEFDDEDYDESDENAEQLPSSAMGFGPELRSISEEEVIRKEFADGKHGDSFFNKSPLARISVVAAGPVFNFILALVFSIVVVSWAGYDYPEIVEAVEGTAAEMAGLEKGDVITKIGDRNVMVTRDVLLYMMFNGNEDVPVEVKHLNEETGEWDEVKMVLDADHYYYQNGRYFSGMNFSGQRLAAESVVDLIKYSVAEVRYTVYAVIEGFAQMFKGQIGKDDIAGPIRIVTIIDDTVEQASPYGAIAVLMNVLNLIVMFSANLGVVNLLPFPALDGGRLVFLFWELVTRKPISQKIENAVNLAGMALLMALMVFVLFNDITFLF